MSAVKEILREDQVTIPVGNLGKSLHLLKTDAQIVDLRQNRGDYYGNCLYTVVKN